MPVEDNRKHWFGQKQQQSQTVNVRGHNKENDDKSNSSNDDCFALALGGCDDFFRQDHYSYHNNNEHKQRPITRNQCDSSFSYSYSGANDTGDPEYYDDQKSKYDNNFALALGSRNDFVRKDNTIKEKVGYLSWSTYTFPPNPNDCRPLNDYNDDNSGSKLLCRHQSDDDIVLLLDDDNNDHHEDKNDNGYHHHHRRRRVHHERHYRGNNRNRQPVSENFASNRLSYSY